MFMYMYLKPCLTPLIQRSKSNRAVGGLVLRRLLDLRAGLDVHPPLFLGLEVPPLGRDTGLPQDLGQRVGPPVLPNRPATPVVADRENL